MGGIMRHDGGIRLLLRYLAVGLVAFAAALSAPVYGGGPVSPVTKINQAAATAEITVESIRPGFSVLMGSGGNITVLSAKEGKLMVDAGIAVSQPRVEAALAKLGPGKVKYLINTHYHWDHTDGNKWVQASGATIIAHKNTLKHVSEPTRVADWNFTFDPLPVAARPKELVDTGKTISFAGHKVIMKNFGNGHTDSDIWVYFPDADVLVLGDIFWNGVYPFIDNTHGGGINQAIRWADHAVEQCGANTVVVPGHGPVGHRAELVEFRTMLATIRDKVAALKKQGKSLDEIIAAKPTAAFDAKYGGFVIDPALFTRLVYAGL
jgi:glyoxylase-like metal-dependent hydrolase (beta-lactamase superfamily II)